MTPLAIVSLSVVVVLLLFAILFYAFVIHVPLLDHLFFRRQGISVAPFRPVTGYLAEFLRYEDKDRNLDFWKDHVTAYGRVHAITLGNSVSLKLNDPAYLKSFFRTHAHCYRPGDVQRMYLDKHLGEHNLLLTEGDEHARHRRTISPAFHHAALADMVDLMTRETTAAIDRWTAAARAEPSTPPVPLDLHEAISSLTFSIIAACAFGAAFRNAPHSLHATMRSIAEQTVWRAVHLVGVLPVLQHLPLWGKPDMDRKKAAMFALIDDVVRERKAGRTAPSPHSGHHDLLDLLLNARDPDTGTALSDEEVRDNAMTMALAGHETTAGALSWSLYALMVRPQLWADCRAEVLAVCGEDPPEARHLSELRLLDAVLSEVLRLFPSAPIISKTVTRDHVLSTGEADDGKPDLRLCAGQNVHIDFHVLHRLSEYWGEDAEEFDHTRWLRGKRPHSHPFAYLPFSSGSRSCIGSQFAAIEAKAVLAVVLQRTTMAFEPGQRLDERGWPVHTSIITQSPKYPLLVSVARRDPVLPRHS